MENDPIADIGETMIRSQETIHTARALRAEAAEACAQSRAVRAAFAKPPEAKA